jgi:hypothetical protein
MKTTAKDFARFKAEFRRWQKRLGLTEWKCYFQHVPLADCYGNITTDTENRTATVRLSTKTPDDAPPPDPIRTARHEAIELLVDDLGSLAQYRYVRYDEIHTARHGIVRRLENLFDEMENT